MRDDELREKEGALVAIQTNRANMLGTFAMSQISLYIGLMMAVWLSISPASITLWSMSFGE